MSRFHYIDEMDFKSLSKEAHSIREKLQETTDHLKKFFIGRDHIIDLMMVSALSSEPLLIVGVPGTAKSDLVTKFRDALGISQESYFEYMLTRFTEPSEIFGPVNIQKMKTEGRYCRVIEGRLPTAEMVFLDEVFKANSAILNSLLTVVNEKKFYDDGKGIPVPLKILIGATNEIPEESELSALKDRFSLKAIAHPVSDYNFESLIDISLSGIGHKENNTKPWDSGVSTLEDVLKAGRYLNLVISRNNSEETKDRDRNFEDGVFQEFEKLVKTLQSEYNVFISDRKITKIYRILRIFSWLDPQGGGVVKKEHLKILSYLGETIEELHELEEVIPNLLNLD